MPPDPQTTPGEGAYCPDCGGPLWLIDGASQCGRRCDLPESDLAHGSQISDPVERVIARALDDVGLKFIHGGPHPALDFYLPDFDLHIECKRASTPRIAEQMSRFDRVIAIQSLEAAQVFAGWLKGGVQ